MKYFISSIALLVLILIFGQVGYYYIECFRQHIVWDKESLNTHNLIYADSSNQFYVGLGKSRLDNFDEALKVNRKVREVTEFKDSSDYYGLFSKKIDMHLLIREKSDTTNKYQILIRGYFDGLCSAKGAKERLMLMLRQIEYDKMPK